MSSSTEDLSRQLMQQMRCLRRAVQASFLDTDEALDRIGLTRESIDPLVGELRARLSRADLRQLQLYEQLREKELASKREEEGGGRLGRERRTAMRLVLHSRV